LILRAQRPVASVASVRTCAFSLVFSAFLVVPSSFAQSPTVGPTHTDNNSQRLEKGKSLHAETDIALVNVSITDPYGRLVTGLDQENFRVFEDNVEHRPFLQRRRAHLHRRDL
jgi:hypothetical protein